MCCLKRVSAADPTPKAIQHASDLGRAYELPDVDVPRLAQYLGQELVTSRTVRAREDLMKLVDRDVLVLQQVGAQLPLCHLGRLRAHCEQCIRSGGPRPARWC
jgi:hypothetical protein